MKQLKILFLVSTIVIAGAALCTSCEKNDPTPSNPLNGKTTSVFNPSVTYGTMTDIDGNVYKTVTIGTQTWMAENLRTTKYNDGSAIPLETDNNKWANLSTDAYCNYNNTSNTDTIATYGRLYNWHAVNTGKLAPTGWHVSTDSDWETLISFLGGEDTAGGKLKEAGTTHWSSPNTGATNETGFTALPGGTRYYDGNFYNFGYSGSCWSTFAYEGSDNALFRHFKHNYNWVGRGGNFKVCGFSVRCVKD